MKTRTYEGVQHGDWVRCVLCGAQMLLPCGADKCPECSSKDTLMCELAGIEIVIHEESYTSKCDFLAFEKIGKHENYLGKRKKRGLFQSSVGKLINADVNGALNIMRKVVGDFCESIRRIIDRGLLFNPVRITNVFC